MSFFDKVPLAPSDPIFGLTVAFDRDSRKNKVNLGAGIYKTEALITPILDSVKAAETALLDLEKNKEYLPIDGERRYVEAVGALVFGKQVWDKEKERISAFQTVGGTGALKIGGTFLKQEVENAVFITDPSWPNHRGVFSNCGLKVENYPYYDPKAHALAFEPLTTRLEKLPPGAIVVFHAACHNPTGCDPTAQQWEILAALLKKKKLIPFFDFAYQGFGVGIEEDAQAVRTFMKNDLEMLVAVSNAKNFSLYGERVGSLFIVSASTKIAEHIVSVVKQIIRTNYSNPPIHGARIVASILETSSLRKQWEEELTVMRERINRLRLALHDRLQIKSKTGGFGHLKKGKGMFGYTGLTQPQVDLLAKEYAIYMPSDGRMNVCGLTHKNLDYVVDSIVAVSK
jgi:aspartate/tyrosine/aromatic aminotransferase